MQRAAWVLALALGAQAASAGPVFEVATVKVNPEGDARKGMWSPPNTGRFVAKSLTMEWLIRLAYGVNASQIEGKPGWLETEVFDVDAKPEEGVKLSREELEPRLQALLQERFHLQAHRETRMVKGYALVQAKGGAKLTPTEGKNWPGFQVDVHPGVMVGKNWTMAKLAQTLGPAAGVPVEDRTGLTGSYDVAVRYAVDPERDAGLPSLTTAVNETLGLQLEPAKVPVEVVVIDRVDRVPVAN